MRPIRLASRGADLGVEARPKAGTEVHVGDRAELAEVEWVSLVAVLDLMPDLFEPVREYLARELAAEDSG